MTPVPDPMDAFNAIPDDDMTTKRKGWDYTTWDVPTLLQWIYAIGMRSDNVISEAMGTDDWSEYDSDEKLYAEIAAELKARGLYTSGKAIKP